VSARAGEGVGGGAATSSDESPKDGHNSVRCATERKGEDERNKKGRSGHACGHGVAAGLPRHDGAGRRRRHYSSGQRQPLAVHKEDREKRNARSGVAGLGPVPGPGGTPATHALVGRGRKQKGSSGRHGQPPLGGNREREREEEGKKLGLRGRSRLLVLIQR